MTIAVTEENGSPVCTQLNCFHEADETTTNGRGEPEGIDPGTLLRPRIRLRDHAGLAPSAGTPHVGGRLAISNHPPRGVLVVELHYLDHQRAGYGGHPGSPPPLGVDARQPSYVGGDTAGFRVPRA